jgi:hypothetical protein
MAGCPCRGMLGEWHDLDHLDADVDPAPEYPVH